MNRISCSKCSGTGFIKNKITYCENNIHKIFSHSCYKCENRKLELKGKYSICDKCFGDGYIFKKLKKEI
tara:strand:- start:1878 stop:2084 length:207 start_codon:yes stop_codon:yes gene_type:complete